MFLSSTYRFLALAALAVSASASSSNIRGTVKGIEESDNAQQQASAHHYQRELIEIDMNIGLGQMVCQEKISDGSIVCTFRTMPPINQNTRTILKDCMYSSTENFCLTSEVYKLPFSTTQVTSPPPPPPPPTTPVTPTLVGTGGTCPAQQPLTGIGCQQNVPSGLTSTTCLYGDFTCKCNLEKGPAWNCYRVMGQQQPPPMTVAPPPPATITVVTPARPPPNNSGSSFSAFQCRPVQSGCMAPQTVASDCSGTPACCPGNIIEDWRTGKNTCKHGGFPTSISASINAIAETEGESGVIYPNLNNRDGCPDTIPLNEPDCDLNFRIKCTYYTGPTNAPTGARDCVCMKGSGKFECKTTSSLPGISF